MMLSLAHVKWRKCASLIALMVIFALVLSSCTPPPPEPEQTDAPEVLPPSPPDSEPIGFPDDPPTPIDVGTIEIQDPDTSDLVDLLGVAVAPTDQVWIFMAEGFGRVDALALASEWGATLVGEVAFVNAFQLQTDDTTVEALLRRVEAGEAMESVEMAMPNLAFFSEDLTEFELSNPTVNASYQTHPESGDQNRSQFLTRPYEMIGLRDAWAMIAGSGLALAPVKVGVLDSSVWGSTPEFNQPGGPLLVGMDVDDMAGVPESMVEEGERLVRRLNHGMTVSNVLAGDHRVGGVIGVASVLGNSITLMAKERTTVSVEDLPSDHPAYVPDGDSMFLIRNIANILEMVSSGCTIINCSFGPRPLPAGVTEEHRMFISSIHRAHDRLLISLEQKHPEVLVIASAGNAGVSFQQTNRFFGQRRPNIMTIAALDLAGDRAGFSNYIDSVMLAQVMEISLAAPGVSILTYVDSEGVAITSQGTSFSTPIVAGAAAILRSIKPDLTAAQIKEILVSTAADRVPPPDWDGILPLDLAGAFRIPEVVSGRILRVDQAVLHTVNLVRREKNLAPYTREELLGLYDFSATAEFNGDSIVVTAAVDNAALGNDDMILMASGPGAKIVSAERQTILDDHVLRWEVHIPEGLDEEVQLRIRRHPAGSEAFLSMQGPFAPPSLLQAAVHILMYLTFEVEGLGRVEQSVSYYTSESVPSHRAEGWEGGITWSANAFAAQYSYDSPAISEQSSVAGLVSADGMRLEWIEVEYEIREQRSVPPNPLGSLYLSVRLKDIPLEGQVAFLEVPDGDLSEWLSHFHYDLKDWIRGSLQTGRTRVTGTYNQVNALRIQVGFQDR